MLIPENVNVKTWLSNVSILMFFKWCFEVDVLKLMFHFAFFDVVASKPVFWNIKNDYVTTSKVTGSNVIFAMLKHGSDWLLTYNPLEPAGRLTKLLTSQRCAKLHKTCCKLDTSIKLCRNVKEVNSYHATYIK
jgi:hypothetical protein